MADPITDAAARKGSAELLIMSVLERAELHGYDIGREIARRSDGLLTFHAASLYPLLYRLEDRGLIQGRWTGRVGQRRRRLYRLTREGRTMLSRQRSRWSSFIDALSKAAGLRHV